VFKTRYRPEGERYRAAPGSLAEFCIEQYRYFLPAAEAVGVPAPAGDPVFHYSPGFEMGVLPEEVHAGGTNGSTADATRRGE
jgi:hypothetical protein